MRTSTIEWFRTHRESHPYRLESVYMECGISRQAHDQMVRRLERQIQKIPLYIGLILEVRQMHPGMGLRTMYEMIRPEGIGRDEFISIGVEAGLGIESERVRVQTTHPHPSSKYENLLVGKMFTDVNQVWSSDITYFKIKAAVYYIVLIMDVYSRRIIGYQASANLRAENNVKALKMALESRGIEQFCDQLIHHSDRGSQYVSESYTDLLKEFGILISMCKNVYENTHLERVNKTIKRQYLNYWNITNLYQLRSKLAEAVYAYNYEKPHAALNKMSPVEYETYLESLTLKQHPKMKIFTIDNRDSFYDPNQFVLF